MDSRNIVNSDKPYIIWNYHIIEDYSSQITQQQSNLLKKGKVAIVLRIFVWTASCKTYRKWSAVRNEIIIKVAEIYIEESHFAKDVLI